MKIHYLYNPSTLPTAEKLSVAHVHRSIQIAPIFKASCYFLIFRDSRRADSISVIASSPAPKSNLRNCPRISRLYCVRIRIRRYVHAQLDASVENKAAIGPRISHVRTYSVRVYIRRCGTCASGFSYKRKGGGWPVNL